MRDATRIIRILAHREAPELRTRLLTLTTAASKQTLTTEVLEIHCYEQLG
jgi:hypothetical protein